jgi:hypothetical protein
MMLQQPEKPDGQHTIPQNCTSIRDSSRARKVRAQCLEQGCQGCTREDDQLSTSSIVGSIGETSRRQQAGPCHRDADEARGRNDWRHYAGHGLAAAFGTWFLSGIIRKKFELTLTSEVAEAGRIYRVTGNATSTGLKSDKAAA